MVCRKKKWIKWIINGVEIWVRIENHNPGAVGEGLIDTIDLIEWAGGAPGSPLIPIKIPDDVKDWLKDNIDKINEHEKAKCDV
jgi:hypothetical protein